LRDFCDYSDFMLTFTGVSDGDSATVNLSNEELFDFLEHLALSIWGDDITIVRIEEPLTDYDIKVQILVALLHHLLGEYHHVGARCERQTGASVSFVSSLGFR
jgi:hypothetical protein